MHGLPRGESKERESQKRKGGGGAEESAMINTRIALIGIPWSRVAR